MNCSSGKKPPHNSTPSALQEESSEVDFVVKKRGGENILDELFNELVQKNPDYKSVMELTRKVRGMEADSLEAFNSFNGKSGWYYNSATIAANEIQDSTVKKAILSLIEKSQSKYREKILPITSLTDQISSNKTSISDLLVVLKITSTIGQIETYQNMGIDQKPIKKLLEKQEELIKQIEELNKKTGYK